MKCIRFSHNCYVFHESEVDWEISYHVASLIINPASIDYPFSGVMIVRLMTFSLATYWSRHNYAETSMLMFREMLLEMLSPLP